MKLPAMFSRTGITSPYKLPEDTKAILEREAKSLGMSLHEFLRDLAILRAHGRDHVASVHIQRITVVAGKVEESQ